MTRRHLVATGYVVRAGKTRYIGCSNLPAWQTAKALGRSDLLGLARFDCVQLKKKRPESACFAARTDGTLAAHNAVDLGCAWSRLLWNSRIFWISHELLQQSYSISIVHTCSTVFFTTYRIIVMLRICLTFFLQYSRFFLL